MDETDGGRTQGTQFGSLPLISLVIPVYDIDPYLAECLDSITQQEFRDIEIIAVDGGSGDSSARILDERKEKEPRLTVIHETRIGPGKARNRGAMEAKGEYIWFVDGDDTLAPGCLEIIAERLEASRPDVLLVNYEDVSANESRWRPADVSNHMRALTSQVFTLEDEPWVIGLSMASWNKIIRRRFLEDTKMEFAETWPHEDVALSGMLLFRATSLSVVDEVCYRYRTYRSGSAMQAGKPDRHFLALDAWELLFKLIGDDADHRSKATAVYVAFFNRAIGHCLAVLATPGFVAASDRRRFFARTHDEYETYLPARYRPPGGIDGIKFRLVARNAYPAYAALAGLRRLQRRLARSGQKLGTNLRPDHLWQAARAS